jgi:hypothetical protein
LVFHNQEISMATIRTLPAIAVAALLLAGGTALAQVQGAKSSGSAPRAPGVTHAVEHPDSSKPDRSSPDPTVDQTQPDSHQPQTAVDKGPARGPETAKDDHKHQPETASDKPTAPSSSEKAAAIAKEGVRSNTPPSPPPER